MQNARNLSARPILILDRCESTSSLPQRLPELRRVHSSVRCKDIFKILTNLDCWQENDPSDHLIPEDDTVKVLRTPLVVQAVDGELIHYVLVSHEEENGLISEGWIPESFLF